MGLQDLLDPIGHPMMPKRIGRRDLPVGRNEKMFENMVANKATRTGKQDMHRGRFYSFSARR
jgi:hypothetical protein